MEMPLVEEKAPLLPDILAPGLDVIFVGAAPSHSSADIGHYYAGPTNKFWLVLHQAGFTHRRLRPEEDAGVVEFGVGLTGVYKRLSTSANHLLPVPSAERRSALRNKLVSLAPLFVCYNGKDVYRMCTGRTCVEWGEQQERVGDARVHVVISSSARADGWARERLEQYRALKRRVDELRTLRPRALADCTR